MLAFGRKILYDKSNIKIRKEGKGMEKKQYKNYVFDLYGTLVDIHTDEEDRQVWEKLALFYGYYGALYTPEELQTLYLELIKKNEKIKKNEMEAEPNYAHEAFPEIQIDKIFQELFQQKGVDAGTELSVHAGQFFRALSTEYIRLYEGVPEMLAAIRETGSKIYLLSNAQRIFTAYEMNFLNISQYFDAILISSDYGTKKPDIRFFHILLDEYGLKPEECIMIGNDAKSDIAGAKLAGMDTYYIHSNISPECEKEPDAVYCQMEMDIQKLCQTLGIM